MKSFFTSVDYELYRPELKTPEAYYGLPRTVRYCKRCVISNQRPSSAIEYKKLKNDPQETINFDENGVCDACNFSDIKEREIIWSDREQELIALLEKHRSGGLDYDVVVPGSGGKDSAFTAHILKYKYGMNPLTVTWAPHMFTDVGRKNHENWTQVGGLDNLLFTPNGRLHRYLTREAFLNLLHPFQPFIVGQRIVGPLIAAKFGIPLVMYGENQAEYGNKVKENLSPVMLNKFFSSGNSTNLSLGGKSVASIIEDGKFRLNELTPYMPLTANEILKKKIEVHYLGYYLKWDPQECYYYAVENTGFQANFERTEGTYSKYSSIDDRIDTFHYYTTLIKFGIGRASYDAAQEIRNKKITREEGVQLVKKFDQEFPKKYFSDFLDYIELSENDFLGAIDRHRSPHIWMFERAEWHLRHPIWNQSD